jgi:hypothetical protein
LNHGDLRPVIGDAELMSEQVKFGEENRHISGPTQLVKILPSLG